MLRHPLALLAALSCLASTAWGADVPVLPGAGTLAAAMAAANAGDTLVLQDGTFGGAVTVNKSLTLRAASRGTYAVLTGSMNVQGDGIQVTLQRLRFTQGTSLTQAAAVRVLENDFASGGIYISGAIGPASGSPAVVIVGNSLANG